jgi:hypothetical protein
MNIWKKSIPINTEPISENNYIVPSWFVSMEDHVSIIGTFSTYYITKVRKLIPLNAVNFCCLGLVLILNLIFVGLKKNPKKKRAMVYVGMIYFGFVLLYSSILIYRC